MIEKNAFIHLVYFWLVNPENSTDRNDLIEGLNTLSALTTIHSSHIGIPAETRRGVVDSSYGVSSLLVFKNKEDQDSYQTDPMHLKFIADCKHLWSKVIVYDTIGM